MASASNRRHVRASLVAGLVALAGASACVQEQDYLIVEQAAWFEDRETCTLSSTGTVPLAMTVDVSFQTRIGMGFVVTNNQSPNANSNSGIDDSVIEVESAEVSLSYSGGALSTSSYEVTVPNNAIAGGDSVPFLVQIPTEIVDDLRASMTQGSYETLEMEVVFVGRKYGASGGRKLGEVRTRAFTYPFDICLGCLADCTECGTCPTTDAWIGTCGFAQGVSIYHPVCDAE